VSLALWEITTPSAFACDDIVNLLSVRGYVSDCGNLPQRSERYGTDAANRRAM